MFDVDAQCEVDDYINECNVVNNESTSSSHTNFINVTGVMAQSLESNTHFEAFSVQTQRLQEWCKHISNKDNNHPAFIHDIN